MNLSEPAGLYVHIPFCVQKCPNCDFYSITDRSLEPAFVDALIAEMRRTPSAGLACDTLYIGGGTPSLLDAAAVGRIIDSAHRLFDMAGQVEITLEVNPGTVSAATLDAYRRAGVNRLNIGVQSFVPAHLKLLGRIHTAADSERCLRWARDAGFERIGLDLMYGLPGQTPAAWRRDLRAALAYAPEHLSCYMLTVEPGTRLAQDRQAGRFIPLAERQAAELFETTVDLLSANGYRQYEISNFARRAGADSQDFCSRHNLKYWSSAPYRGFGPGAHSFQEPERWWNHADLHGYLAELAAGQPPPGDRETLSRSQLLIEAIFLGLRQSRGIWTQRLDERFGICFQSRFNQPLRHLEQAGLMVVDPDRCYLTVKGMLVLDSVVDLLVAHLDA